MKHYLAKTLNYTKSGFTDLWILQTADWITNATTAHVLTALAVGDAVYRVQHDLVTYLAGPATGTVSVGVVGALTTFTAASDIKSAAAKYVGAVASVTPYQTNTAVNMVANAILGAGAVTAGELWIWANISRLVDRQPEA